MQVLEAKKPFEIQEVELSEWKQRPVKNNFFELVLVKDGEGTQCINYSEHSYTKENIFLLPPLKCHSFQINSPSKFVFLKFTDAFFKNNHKNSMDRNQWLKEATYILSNYNQLPGDIIKSDTDRKYIISLTDMILQESRSFGNDSISLITSFMTSILEILIRNIKKGEFYEIPNNTDDRITKMLTYINENIDKTEELKIDNLANTFAMSPTYVSEFFKKQVHISLRDYILKAKLKMVEIRLLNSDHTLSEIAYTLGFTDASHLSKTFKKHVGLSIKEFKNGGDYVLLKRASCSA